MLCFFLIIFALFFEMFGLIFFISTVCCAYRLRQHKKGPVCCFVWLGLVMTEALFGKTEDPFCKTDICYEVLNMYMFCMGFQTDICSGQTEAS